MIRGECSDCGKTYKVPSADRTYTCKACNGVVRVPEPEEPKPAVPCPDCGEWNDAEDAFCVECGVSLKPKSARQPGTRQKTSATQKRTHTQRKERAVASKELAQAKKGIFIARVIFSLFAFGMLMTGLALIASSGRGMNIDGENAKAILRISGIISLLLGFIFVGIVVFLPRAPLVLGIIGASIYTVFQFLGLLVGEMSVGSSLWTLAFVVFVWCAVIPLARVRRIQRDYPDLFGARAWGGKDGRIRAEAIGESRAKVERQSSKRGKQDLKLRLVILGSIVFVLGGGGFFLWLSKQPSDLKPRLEGFRQAWESSDTGLIQPYFATQQRTDLDKWMRYREKKRDWDKESWPRLVESRIVEMKSKSAYVDFPLDTETLSSAAHLHTRWEWRETAWFLDSIRLIR